MKPTIPTAPPVKSGGSKDPNWLIAIYAIANVVMIIIWAYIISHR